LKPDRREQSGNQKSVSQGNVIMNTKLFVGNLSFETSELELQDLFAACGPVTEVNIVTDRFTQKPRGFAFVTMATPEGAQAAIQQLAGKPVNGRNLTVNEARPREERSGGGGGGGYGGGRGGGGGDRGPRRDRGPRY
jgi:RNA recognition motif-containing protein